MGIPYISGHPWAGQEMELAAEKEKDSGKLEKKKKKSKEG